MPNLNFVGKSKVVNHHREVSFRFLEKQYGSSENMIIHGDNLLALRSLIATHRGKIKCIYIDPPYNTGNENWIYNDNVNDPEIRSWIGKVVGDEETDLNRHDKWLCMMYPRLRLLHELLSDDGAIFISIDDNEVANLKLICNEIFGINNFVDRITVIVKPEGRRYGFFAKTHENILVFAKKIGSLSLNEIEVEGKKYDYQDELGGFNLRGLRNRNVRAFNSSNRPNLRYPFYVDVEHPNSNDLFEVSTENRDGFLEVWAQTIDGLESVWRWGKEKSTRQIQDLCAYRGRDGVIRIFQKERKLTEMPKTVWNDKNFASIVGTREIKNIFGKNVFDYPKPIGLLKQIMTIATDPDSIVLDAFAGSGTTAQSVIELNQENSGSRKFILIESMNYCESITAERVRRIDGEFSFYELGDPIFIDGELNSNLSRDLFRRYLFYSETKKEIPPMNPDESTLLGINDGIAYHLIYGDLNFNSLAQIKTRAESYIIFAESCMIDQLDLDRLKIYFRKIPRDIRRI